MDSDYNTVMMIKKQPALAQSTQEKLRRNSAFFGQHIHPVYQAEGHSFYVPKRYEEN